MSASKKLLMSKGADEMPRGESVYAIPGTYTWTCPANVTSVSVVCIGAGAGGNADKIVSTFAAGGGGGALAYANNITVTPGSNYTVIVGQGGTCAKMYNAAFVGTYVQGDGGNSSFASSCEAGGGKQGWLSNTGVGGTVITGTGGSGGAGGYRSGEGQATGGGAGGYAGNGAAGVDLGYTSSLAGTAAPSGGGGGSGGGANDNAANGSGGVGYFGQGTSGSAGASSNSVNTGGSGGGDGWSTDPEANLKAVGQAGSFGAGGGAYIGDSSDRPSANGHGANGAVRIIWPGDEREFPSTDCGTP